MIPESTAVIQEAVDTTLIHPETASSGGLPTEDQEGGPPERPGADSKRPRFHRCGALMLCYLLFSYLRMRCLVAEAVPEAGNIWICDSVVTPFILGLLRPRIYLPSGLSGETKAYVIAHEQSHLRWKDHWWKPMAFILLAIYWFDPFVWVAYELVCRDIEFACDERVVRHFGMAEKKAYSKALLECSARKRLVLACPVAFGETAVAQRVRSILNYKKPGFWIILVSSVAVLVTAIGFLIVPKKSAAPDLQEPGTIQTVPSTTTPPAQTQPTTAPAATPEGNAPDDEWADFPDGIRIETYKGETFTAPWLFETLQMSIWQLPQMTFLRKRLGYQWMQQWSGKTP